MHFLRFWREKSDVTPPNVVETNNDINKMSKMALERRQIALHASAQLFVAE